MLLIPSIDLRGGRCVRLRQGDFATESSYSIEPAELAGRYHRLGARWLHVVDLDGAKDGLAGNLPIIMALARLKSLRLQVGGGVRHASVIETLLSAGIARVVVGTAAIERPGEVAAWLQQFGPERICLAFDVRLGPGGEPQLRTDGWTRNSTLDLAQAVSAFLGASLQHVLCTDIERDGMLRGPNLRLYRECLTRFPGLEWQASGGIRDRHDLTALEGVGLAAAVSGTAMLEERISAEELRPFLPGELSPA
ncbi:MAG TPA: 1-(5-phosphoribosyl)-5-[(5-phosphoribosylamino)methylideneamino] imidazole-4-carboxamide isomerase [Steroidobacteraceae bacterium]|nr:1-(5-phosphoribosyl)-5-[(5-phosphoribosylamino)methylideneamino] imidazole-4-carboxamide isomerase [Steroidobacteraceae bacterium]